MSDDTHPDRPADPPGLPRAELWRLQHLHAHARADSRPATDVLAAVPRLLNEVDRLTAELDQIRAERDALAAERDRLRAMLREYGRHKRNCLASPYVWMQCDGRYTGVCDCGFDEACGADPGAAPAAGREP